MQTGNLLNELSELCGIIPEYWDIFGVRHSAPEETKRAVLKAMGLSIKTDEDIRLEIKKRRERPWNRFMEPVRVISVNDQPVTTQVYLPLEEGHENDVSVSWIIRNEEGGEETSHSFDGATVSEQKWIDGIRHVRIELGDEQRRDIGYYTLSATCRNGEKVFQGSCRLIISPDQCYIHPSLSEGKTWGFSLNLYSLRSRRNWGIGDLDDLEKMVSWASGLDCSFIGINPLHAIENKRPFGISPYSPISRLYRNYIYLDIDAVPEVMESGEAQAFMKSGGFERELEELRKADLIDYERTAWIKLRILRAAFEYFCRLDENSPRIRDFKKYDTDEGETLDSFATYMALADKFAQNHGPRSAAFNWREWPEEYHDPAGDAVLEFRRTDDKAVLFHKYVQWLIDTQLGGVSRLASELGMSLGLYHDLAIGSIGGGSDAWNYQGVVTHGIDVGAPPDDFNITGQNWGFPPLVPERLKDAGYDFFIQTIRRNMRYGGALRIDHALGMFRLFWIPEGMPAGSGAYVRFPSKDLIRIISLESVRNRTMVIAEDLGTIGENARETLQGAAMLSYRLLYFERNYPDPSFAAPEKYPSMALCSVTTHDLPTISGYWSGRDIEVKERLGLYKDENVRERHIRERERDKALLVNALRDAGVVDGSGMKGEMTPELRLAVYDYLSRSCCKIITVSLDDAIGALDQQNMPGVTDSYPSWMQKTVVTLEDILLQEWFFSLSGRLKKRALSHK